MRLEGEPLEAQTRIDASTNLNDRNRLGQFATNTRLANEMLAYARELFLSQEGIRFLDPAFGTGAFFSALLGNFPASRIDTAVGFEIDPAYARAAAALWGDRTLRLEVSDFTRAKPPEDQPAKFNLVICNPPYVRHHHIGA